MFQGPAPAPIFSVVHDALIKNNWEQSKRCSGVLPIDESAAQSPVAASSVQHHGNTESLERPKLTSLEVLPPEEWFSNPIGRREPTGHSLLESALSKIRNSVSEGTNQDPNHSLLCKANLWAVPFSWFLSMWDFAGFKTLELVETHTGTCGDT